MAPKRNLFAARRTVLAAGEGRTEIAIMRHLASVFLRRDVGTSIRFLRLHGGSPSVLVRKSLNLRPQNFDSAFVLLDRDVEWPAGLESEALSQNLHLIGSTPCIEGLLLDILEPGLDRSTWKSHACKARFHDRYLDGKAKLKPARYEPILTESVVLNAIARCSTLRNLLTRMFPGQQW